MDRGAAVGRGSPLLTLEFVPDIVGPFLDLRGELFQVILSFWVNKRDKIREDRTALQITSVNRGQALSPGSGPWQCLFPRIYPGISDSLFVKGMFQTPNPRPGSLEP